LDSLAALYAIGVIGAVAINVSLCAFHPRLRRMHRKTPMIALGVVLLAIWITLAFVKHEALIFVTIVIAVGLAARQLNHWLAGRKGPKPSILRQAIAEQLVPEVALRPKVLLATTGSDAIAPAAFAAARDIGAVMVVCFVRQVNLSYKYDAEQRLTIDTDLAALRTFSRYLDLGHEHGVSIIPVYDTGHEAATQIAEAAAMYGVEQVLIGTSRRGALHKFIKGNFQQQLEQLLPSEVKVTVVTPAVHGQSGASESASKSHPTIEPVATL
jgi:hypothetical protein